MMQYSQILEYKKLERSRENQKVWSPFGPEKCIKEKKDSASKEDV